MPKPTSSNIILAENLTKRFGTFTAVNGVNFSVTKGECFGLLGPNGAGKTSIARMIFGFSPLSDGKLMVLDKDIRTDARKIKAQLGVVAQEDNLDPELTVRENLLVYATYFSIPPSTASKRTTEILEFMDLSSKADSVVEELSGGMKRRLTLGRALINEPKLLILDEPTTGLDPYARHMVWQRLRRLKENGTTMLLTTHYLEEASQLCDRLIIINHGNILDEGTPSSLIESYVGQSALELIVDPEWHNQIIDWCSPLLKTSQQIGNTLILYSERGQAMTEKLMPFFVQNMISPSFQRLRATNLEDVFLKLTGKTLETSDLESDFSKQGGYADDKS